MKKIILSLLSLFFVLQSSAQKQVFLNISHKLGNANFAFNQTSQNNLGQNFQITRVDYYLSRFAIIHDGGMLTMVDDSTYILAKGSANVSADLGTYTNITNVEGIRFSVGVEKVKNMSDPALWVSPHPLAPQNPAMHWGWASGYRFVALEGNAGPTFVTNFQLHGLFNENYFEQVVMVNGKVSGNSINIDLNADYKRALEGINVNAGPINHGDNTNDLIMLQNFRDFVFSPWDEPSAVSNTIQDIHVNLYPNPSTGNVMIDCQQSNIKVTSIVISDMTGRTIQHISMQGKTNTKVDLKTSGFYLVKVMYENQVLAVKKIIIQ